MKVVLRILSVFLVLMVLLKIVFWMRFDIPIGTKGVLYLLALIGVLNYYSKWTYILLWGLILMPAVYRVMYFEFSGYSPFLFTDSLYIGLRDNYEALAHVLFSIPKYFYVLLGVLFVLPMTVRLYWNGKQKAT